LIIRYKESLKTREYLVDGSVVVLFFFNNYAEGSESYYTFVIGFIDKESLPYLYK